MEGLQKVGTGKRQRRVAVSDSTSFKMEGCGLLILATFNFPSHNCSLQWKSINKFPLKTVTRRSLFVCGSWLSSSLLRFRLVYPMSSSDSVNKLHMGLLHDASSHRNRHHSNEFDRLLCLTNIYIGLYIPRSIGQWKDKWCDVLLLIAETYQ